jgi:hypothetical protein
MAGVVFDPFAVSVHGAAWDTSSPAARVIPRGAGLSAPSADKEAIPAETPLLSLDLADPFSGHQRAHAPFFHQQGAQETPITPTVGTGNTLEPPGELSGGIVGSDGAYVDILLTWTYDDIGAKLFQIDRSVTAESHVPVGKVDYLEDVDVTHYQFLDKRLPKGPTYHYWVKAVGEYQQSPWSEMFVIATA